VIRAAALVLLTCVTALAQPSPSPHPTATAAATATAASSTEARAHYEAGQRAYDRGDYERAIDEFEQAYRLKPHPNVLYNIAQAHERLLDYAKSVEWFERYLREAPRDAENRPIVENRLRILRNLPARISITSIPEHVHATLVTGKQEYKGDTPITFKVPAGDYQVYLDFPGWEAERHDLAADIGQPYFYQYRLKRSTSSVQVFSRPRGARVFIDNHLVGETPFADAVEVGKHQLLLEHPEYPWFKEEIEVKPNQPLKREIKMTRPIRSGRTELVIWSMLYGGILGEMLVGAISDFKGLGGTETSLPLQFGASLAGIGLGFVGSFLATPNGIKVGHSSLIIGGGCFGLGIGASLALGLDVPNQYVYALAILGSGLGTATGVLVSRYTDTSPGDAAVFNSGGLWGTVSGLLLAQAIFDHPSLSELGWFTLGGTVLGGVAGTLASWRVEISRGHMGLVDLGGVAGGGLGFALGYIIGGTQQGGIGVQDGSRYALGGMALGLFTAAILSRNYKGDLSPAEALITHEHGRWAMGIPNLNFGAAQTQRGLTSTLTLDLLQGTW
jgi:hypothetical protein